MFDFSSSKVLSCKLLSSWYIVRVCFLEKLLVSLYATNAWSLLFQSLVRVEFEEGCIHPLLPVDDILELIQMEYGLLFVLHHWIIQFIQAECSIWTGNEELGEWLINWDLLSEWVGWLETDHLQYLEFLLIDQFECLLYHLLFFLINDVLFLICNLTAFLHCLILHLLILHCWLRQLTDWCIYFEEIFGFCLLLLLLISSSV